MKPLALLRPLSICSSSPRLHCWPKPLLHDRSFHVSCSSSLQQEPGFIDDVFLTVFRNKMVKEVGWDSEKPGYDGLIEVANRLMLIGKTNSETRGSDIKVSLSYTDIGSIQIANISSRKWKISCHDARVTALTCQLLMGTCTVNSVDVSDGTSCQSGVFIEKCKYLEESKCLGICINTCKLPTQTFFKDCMGVPLLIEPNFKDYSCQFKFGVLAPQPEDDSTIKEPCLEICPNQSRRRPITQNVEGQCPKA